MVVIINYLEMYYLCVVEIVRGIYLSLYFNLQFKYQLQCNLVLGLYFLFLRVFVCNYCGILI